MDRASAWGAASSGLSQLLRHQNIFFSSRVQDGRKKMEPVIIKLYHVQSKKNPVLALPSMEELRVSVISSIKNLISNERNKRLFQFVSSWQNAIFSSSSNERVGHWKALGVVVRVWHRDDQAASARCDPIVSAMEAQWHEQRTLLIQVILDLLAVIIFCSARFSGRRPKLHWQNP